MTATPVLEDDLAAEVGGEREEEVPGETDGEVGGEFFGVVGGGGVEEDAPGEVEDEAPGAKLATSSWSSMGSCGMPARPAPDFGVDATDEGEEETEGSGGGAAECGPVGAGGFVDGAGEIEEEAGEEEDDGKLDEFGVEVTEELPKFHEEVLLARAKFGGGLYTTDGELGGGE